MVLGDHVVLGMYGFWLPNGPRGSYSDFVWANDLRKFGAATKVKTRQPVAGNSHDVKRTSRRQTGIEVFTGPSR